MLWRGSEEKLSSSKVWKHQKVTLICSLAVVDRTSLRLFAYIFHPSRSDDVASQRRRLGIRSWGFCQEALEGSAERAASSSRCAGATVRSRHHLCQRYIMLINWILLHLTSCQKQHEWVNESDTEPNHNLWTPSKEVISKWSCVDIECCLLHCFNCCHPPGSLQYIY